MFPQKEIGNNLDYKWSEETTNVIFLTNKMAEPTAKQPKLEHEENNEDKSLGTGTFGTKIDIDSESETESETESDTESDSKSDSESESECEVIVIDSESDSE